jgi:hypothetical protein
MSNELPDSFESDSSNDPSEHYNVVCELKKANLFYCFQFLIWSVFCLILKAVQNQWLLKISNIEGKSSYEISISFSSRISLSLLFWYLVHSVLTLQSQNLIDSFQYRFHTSYLAIHWIVQIKYLLVQCGFLIHLFIFIFIFQLQFPVSSCCFN